MKCCAAMNGGPSSQSLCIISNKSLCITLSNISVLLFHKLKRNKNLSSFLCSHSPFFINILQQPHSFSLFPYPSSIDISNFTVSVQLVDNQSKYKSPQMASSGVNVSAYHATLAYPAELLQVLRYSALGAGVAYGIWHQSVLTEKAKRNQAERDYQHQLSLVEKAKKDYAKKLSPQAEGGGGECKAFF